jgi:two-component system LytT family sensor kinase
MNLGSSKTNLSFSRYPLVIPYIIMWMVLAAVHMILLKAVYKLDTGYAVADSLVFNILFAILGMGLWYMTRFSDLKKKTLTEVLLYHLTGMTVSVLLWLGAGYLILSAAFAGQPGYLVFLKHSVVIRIISGMLLYGLLVSLAYLIVSFRELRERIEHEAQLKAQLRDAELSMLRSQIRPHFLFNSLNSISALTVTDSAKAQDMIIKLSEFMRYSLSQTDETMSTLEKEMAQTGLYLDIEKVRYGERLTLATDIAPPCMTCRLPAMILQPLIENAVKHGVYGTTEKVTVTITAALENGDLHLVLSNNYDPSSGARKGTGTGLKNVGNRLVTLFGRSNLLQIEKSGDLFRVHLIIPQHGKD